MSKLLFSVTAMFLLGGCATLLGVPQSTVTVYSTPEGAYITESGTGRALGIAPVTSYYNTASLQANGTEAGGCYLVKGFEARWVSGATASVPTVRLCNGPKAAYNVSLSRNSSYPGLQNDLEFAIRLKALRLQAQQAQAAEDAAAAQLFSAFTAAQQSTAPVRCSTRKVGNTVQTVCQ